MEQLALWQGLSMLSLFSSSRCTLFVDSCTYNWCIISNKPPSVCQITWLVVWTISFSQIGLSPLLFRSNYLKGGGGVGGENSWEGEGFADKLFKAWPSLMLFSTFPHLFLPKLSSSEIFWLFLLPEKSILISSERKNTIIHLCALINLMWHWSLFSYAIDSTERERISDSLHAILSLSQMFAAGPMQTSWKLLVIKNKVSKNSP